MYVGMARITLAISGSHSLKEKRMVLRRIKDRVRDATRLAISEVGAQDTWQRAELGCAVASGERQQALEQIDAVVRIVASCAEVVGVAKDAWTFDTEPVTFEKPTADDWIPDAWREELDT